MYKRAYDISRKGSHPHPTPTSQQILPQNHNIQIIGCKLFLLYSLNYLSIIMYFSFFSIIGFCIIIHPMICSIVILGENLVNGWCRMRMRPAQLVSYAFLYTTLNVSFWSPCRCVRHGFCFFFHYRVALSFSYSLKKISSRFFLKSMKFSGRRLKGRAEKLFFRPFGDF